MPFDRFETERSITMDLLATFENVKAALDNARPVDWRIVEEQIAADVRDEINATVVGVLLLMLGDDELLFASTIANKIAFAQSHTLARALVSNVSQQVRGGAALDSVFTPARAATIAATEVTRAQTQAETIAREQVGRRDTNERRSRGESVPVDRPRLGPLDVVPGEDVVWVTSQDDRVCPICAPLDGLRYAGWADKFPFGPPAHPNCRCTLHYPRIP